MVGRKTGRFVAIVASLVALVACDNDGTGPDDQLRDVQVAFGTTRASTPGAVAPRVFFDDTLTSGTDTVIVTRVGIVMREIELKRTGADNCAEGDDACEKFEVGPVLVELPLDGSVEVLFAVNIPDGSFSEIEFEIHKIDGDDPADQLFAQQNPDFVDQSIRVEGTFNGTSFLFETDLDVEIELDLNPPLVVDSMTGPSAISVIVDIDGWFRDGNGVLVDPATGNKGGENESLIKENIKVLLEAFEDDDLDGGR